MLIAVDHGNYSIHAPRVSMSKCGRVFSTSNAQIRRQRQGYSTPAAVFVISGEYTQESRQASTLKAF